MPWQVALLYIISQLYLYPNGYGVVVLVGLMFAITVCGKILAWEKFANLTPFANVLPANYFLLYPIQAVYSPIFYPTKIFPHTVLAICYIHEFVTYN